ncbi:hypothetical protein DVH24_018680 [Malus domestica]|uniref:Uncharacterized protein n=1 Tax=Malus domestica TaxID=3750 RepID=A0A498HP52_MALDO|nr:hypothetical protein DVH24_018680 [Malus domestica]
MGVVLPNLGHYFYTKTPTSVHCSQTVRRQKCPPNICLIMVSIGFCTFCPFDSMRPSSLHFLFDIFPHLLDSSTSFRFLLSNPKNQIAPKLYFHYNFYIVPFIFTLSQISAYVALKLLLTITIASPDPLSIKLVVLGEICEGPIRKGGLRVKVPKIQGLPLYAFPIFQKSCSWRFQARLQRFDSHGGSREYYLDLKFDGLGFLAYSLLFTAKQLASVCYLGLCLRLIANLSFLAFVVVLKFITYCN